jgi:hypothetical protein
VKSKAKIPVDVSSSVSITDRRNSFLKEIKILLNENKTIQDVRDRIRIHISFYNDDKEFSKLLDLQQTDLELFLDNYDDATNVMTQIGTFYKNISSKTEKNEVETLKDRLRSVVFPVNKSVLYMMDSFVFESIEFTPDYNIILFPALIHTLLNDLNLTTLVEMRKYVHQYMFEHRFEYVIRYLENDSYSDSDKQFMVSETIKSEFENIHSIRLYLLIMNIIDQKITPFQKPLQSLLLRYLPEKEYFTTVKNFLEIILEIVINKPSDKQLAKYFANKKKLEHFRTKFLPLLQNEKEYSKLIRNHIRQEFEQPYVFRYADRVKWETYLEIVRKHLSKTAMSSMEVDIYNSLKKNDSDILDKMIVLLENPENVNKSQIQILLSQYINLQTKSKQNSLEKLKNISSFSTLKTLLIEIRDVGYIETLNTLSTTTPKKTPLMKSPSLMDQNDSEILYKYRFDIPNFDHMEIEPIDNIAVYGTTIPNDLFYRHLVDPKIIKTQKGQVFTMNKLRMKVRYVTITNDYSYQNEESYTQGLVFIKTQQGLDSATHHLSFYTYFMSCPILNHQSSLMKILRQKSLSRLSTVFIKQFQQDKLCSSIEHSIYMFSESLNEYTTSISILITLLELKYTQTIKQLFIQRSIKISEIGKLLKEPIDVVFQVLFPEIYTVNDKKSLLMLFENNHQELKRRIILDTYFIQNPMRRIPYIPINRYLGGDLDKIEIITEIQPIPTDLSDKYLQEPIIEVEEVTTVIPISTKELEDEIIMEELDPLADFIDSAFDELDNL